MAETIRGLPEPLPEGEHVLWQGAPDRRSFLLHAFHLRKLAIYFGVILLLRGVFASADGSTAVQAVIAAAWLLPVAGTALVLVTVLGLLTARSTIYAITERRVVMRIGVVLQITFNIPYRNIETAELRAYGDGSGDLPLQLYGDDHLAWLHLWPHVRPWRLASPQPMLRCVPNARQVAQTLATALADHAGIAALRPVAPVTAAWERAVPSHPLAATAR
jgi:hypothetical protein